MVKPLRSDTPNPPSVQFKDFGVLNDGSQSKGAFTTSIITNLVLAALVVVIGSVVHTTIAVNKKTDLAYVEPIKDAPKPPPPPPPKLKIPPPPPPPKMEPPKIKLPTPEKLPELKPVEVKMAPVALKIAPAPPKAVTPPPAPVAIKLATPTAASVANHDANPSPVRLGQPTNMLKPLTGPAVSPVNMGVAGHPNMPAGNTGSGAPSKVAIAGSGSPGSQNMAGHSPGAVTITGVKTGGVTGGTGTTRGTGTPVAIVTNTPPVKIAPPAVQTVAATGSAPKLLSRPQPVYTDEAKAMHLEGSVVVQIHVTASGSVQVIGVTRGLGHGLDDQARRVAQGMRFQPATDGSGRPKDWDGPVTVTFQLAG